MPLRVLVSAMKIRVASWLREMPDLARQALFRPQCRICGRELVGRAETVVCADCLAMVKLDSRSACPRCGLFREAGGPCGACRIAPPPYRRHLSFAAYEGVLRQLVVLYKYGEVEPLKKTLAGYLRQRLACAAAGPFDLVMPVPGDPRRRRDFQPAGELARQLARSLHLPLAAGNLRKVRSTPAQAGLKREQRLRNLRGAFRLRRPGAVRRQRVLLVDDVFTTGSTLRACARVLARAGAAVTAVTVAQSVWNADEAGAPDGRKNATDG